MAALKNDGVFVRACGLIFIVLNGIICIFGFFFLDVRGELTRHFDHIAHDSSKVIRRDSVLHIDWFDAKYDRVSSFYWVNMFNALFFAHIFMLIAASIMVTVLWPVSRSTTLFSTYCLMISTAALLRVFVITSFYEPSSQLYSTTLASALAELEAKYRLLSDSSYVSMLNTWMAKGFCCGINGPFDFQKSNLTIDVKDYIFPYTAERHRNLYFPPGKVHYKFRVPPACCRPYLFNKGTDKESFEAVRDCALGDNADLWMPLGCLERITIYMSQKLNYIYLVIGSMFGVEICALTIAIFFAFYEGNRPKVSRMLPKGDEGTGTNVFAFVDEVEDEYYT